MEPIDPAHAASLTAQLDTVIAAISPHGAGNVDVYVSLDRDVLQRNFTQYNDGPFPPVPGITAVENCLQHLVNVGTTLIGFDVCGLPTFPGATSDDEKTVPPNMALAQAQVTRLWNYIIPL